MGALAFSLALGIGNEEHLHSHLPFRYWQWRYASFCPLRTPPHHARVDLPLSFGVTNPKTLPHEARAFTHDDMTFPPTMVPAVILLPPFPPSLCLCSISPCCFPSIIPVPSPHVDCLVPLPPTPASLSPSHSRRPGNATSKCNTTVWVSSLPFPRVVHGLAGNVGNMLMTCLRPATCQNVANFFSDMPIPATRFSCVGTL